MPIDFEYILLLIVALAPVYYKFSFWLYLFQLKEYRFDRFFEYFKTKQWKNAYFNFWFLLEFPIFITSLTIFFDKNLEIIIFPTIFYFLLIENIFVFWKIFRNKILKPKLTQRLILTKLIILLLIFIDLYFIIFWWYEKFIFMYLWILLLLTPFLIYIAILFSLPIINYQKRKKINKAISISKNFNKPIKIWITWSYWKSSVKEYLSFILLKEAKTLYTPENINTELWVSDLIINKLDDDYKYFVAEMWAYKIWEIKQLWEIVNHKYWFLTAIWNQHIWLFWSQENIIKWKSEIQEKVLKNKWVLYINWNNENIRKVKFNKKLNIVKYWNFEWSDAIWKFIKMKKNNFIFSFEYKDINTEFETNLLWEHNIINLTWIIAFCIDQNIDIKKIKKYIKNLHSPKNTLQITNKTINNNELIIINDTYNLSEDWLFAWLNILNYLWKKHEKYLVLDDILELWNNASNIHFDIWFKIATEKKVDKIILVWINYKQNFINWLIKWWFDKNNILNNIENISKDSIVLLEWRNASKFNFL